MTLFPAFVLAAIIPLLACRQWLGWQFTLRSEPTRPRAPNSTEDWLGATAVVATTFMMARVPQVYWEMNTTQYWAGMGFGWTIIVAVATVAVLPATYLVFRIRNQILGWLGLIGLCLLSPVGTYIGALIITATSVQGQLRSDFIWDIVVSCTAATSIALSGVLVLKVADYGYRFLRRELTRLRTQSRHHLTNPAPADCVFAIGR